jgi:hypothetical protein
MVLVHTAGNSVANCRMINKLMRAVPWGAVAQAVLLSVTAQREPPNCAKIPVVIDVASHYMRERNYMLVNRRPVPLTLSLVTEEGA